ncbi:ThuA domain-containing protein [Chitinophaga qingshengii]|uniref:ThuA domain-containing protein n=1 Tax=Chitinophaga qingshengii TaxID=1569794 RepID=A0ABR7TF78_9BACT|nr:ThuA domain-containing protein [Chitinophaga qingshengii]MBC9928924.1 ThuA domain-containing protein [Chitinophaga qingshengii]
MKRIYVCLLFIISTAFACTAQSSKNGKKPVVVFVTGDHEYSSEETMPVLAAALEKDYGIKTIVLKAYPDHNSEENIPGLEALQQADLAVFFLRWRLLPPAQLAYIEAYLKSGKPVMGFRTTTHAFHFPEGHASEKWNAFGKFALNAPPGWGGEAKHTHYGHESSTDVSVIPEQAGNPILTGVAKNFHVRSWLYRVLPDYPVKGSTWLLMGKAVNPDKEAIDNPVAWTGTNSFGGKVFMTTLGHPDDFTQVPFQRLLINAIHDELGLKVPRQWKGPIDFHVPYREAK